ncbi:MAG: P-type conjugative transfer protein TrbG [Alphaproteobacteria bacterium]
MLSKTRKILCVSAVALMLQGCVVTQQLESLQSSFDQTHFVTAKIEKKNKVDYIPVPIPVAKPYVKKLPDVEETMVKAKKVSPEKVIEDARKAALQKSTPDGFINAMQVFDYMPGALYEIYSSPGYITSIVLKPGENLIAKTAGDTVRWIMGETMMGAGKDQRVVLLVKPLKPNLSTNMMITTDQRIYMLEAKSMEGGVYNASVTWNYPHDDFDDLKQKAINTAIQEEQIVAGQVNLNDLNYDYDIEVAKGKEPDWMPVETFDDGYKTYIRFSNNLGTTKAPVLYVLADNGDTEIVNYRVRGNFYVIDRIIKKAELRLGTKYPRIVHITRQEKGNVFANLFKGSGYKSSGYNE